MKSFQDNRPSLDSAVVSISYSLPKHPHTPKPLKAQSKLETKRNGGTKVLFVVMFILFVLYSLSILYPLLWGFITSLMSKAEYNYHTTYVENIQEVFALPSEYHWENYAYAFLHLEDHGVNFLQMFWNSLWFSVGSSVLSLFFTSLTSYVISKYKFPGNRVIYTIAVFVLMIPIYGSFPATFKLYHDLGMVDSPLILLSATGGFGSNFILLCSYYKNISWTYAEAAQMDGASHWKIYWKVMFPLARPMIASMFLLQFVNHWNDYMASILYLNGNYTTLAAGLYDYQTVVVQSGDYPYLFAGLFLSLIPVLILFATLSKTMMKNMTFGGIKG